MNTRLGSTRTTLLVISLGLLSLAAGATAWRIYRAQQPPGQATLIVLPEPRIIADFALTDEQGKAVSLADLENHWSLLFFGFTSCPDVCPNTLYQLHLARQTLLGEEAAEALPRVYLVSVDPQRDTPEKLAAYLHYFDPAFGGLTGDPAQLQALAMQLGVAFFIQPHETGELDYSVDHSAALLLLNPEGQLYAVMPAPHDADRIAKDLLQVIRGHL